MGVSTCLSTFTTPPTVKVGVNYKFSNLVGYLELQKSEVGAS